MPSESPAFRRIAVARFALLAVLPIAAAGARGEGEVITPRLGGTLASAFPYDPEVRTRVLAEAPDPTVQGELSPEVVMLPEFEVNSTAIDLDLARAIENSRPVRESGPRKLGTGVVQKDFGKTRIGAVTVLYIPIFIGFSW